MTHSHFDTWHHNKISKARRANNMTRDSKSVNLTHFRRLSICNLFSRNTSHSHDNLRRVSKSPLLHPFTHRWSGTLDWRVTKATSADSSRLIHTILAHSSIALFYSSTSLYLSIFHRHRTSETRDITIAFLGGGGRRCKLHVGKYIWHAERLLKQQKLFQSTQMLFWSFGSFSWSLKNYAWTIIDIPNAFIQT
jgi:hypothetical protein